MVIALSRRFLLSVVAVAAIAGTALGQGTVIVREPVPPPWRPNRVTTMPLVLKYQRVYTDIVDGVATTRMEQTFTNPMSTVIEGTYIFPIPDEASVSDFSMTAGGKTLMGEVLDAETARRTYEEIVRRTRDPGLLEYLGSRLYRANIFPIPPGGQLDVKLQYTQTIKESGGLGSFRHPFRTDQPDAPPVESVTVQVKIRSTLPLAGVFCPTHKCDVSRPNDYEATATYEQSHVRPDRDFLLYYQRKDAQFGISLLTHRSAGEPGYFLLRISPRVEAKADETLPKDIAFVIDTSGSMQGGKMEQAKRSLKFCINALSPQDRFNIFAFSTGVHPFRDGLVPVDADVKKAATEFAEQMQAMGGTNINQALLGALAANPKDSSRPYLVVFMTDGEPTVDVTDPELILRNVKASNPSGAAGVRFHVLGVGNQLNTHLLDKLALETRGSADYCTESEDLELKLSAFVTRLANPVLTDIELNLAGLNTFDQYPRDLPDLFRGNDLLLLGRYDGEGHHAIELKGQLRGAAQKLTYEGEFPKVTSSNEFLPRLWAIRKVGYLLDQIRLHGRKKELVDEVVSLAKRHGIVTEFTSALILEDDGRLANRPASPLVEREMQIQRLARDRVGRMGGGGAIGGDFGGRMEKKSGEQAVADSQTLRSLQALGYNDGTTDAGEVAAGRAPASTSQPREPVVRQVAAQTFVFDGRRWVDTTWDGKQSPRQVKAFSDEYFKLVTERPALARYFAQGPRVLAVLDGDVFETVED